MAQGVRNPDRHCIVCGKQLARRKKNPDRPDLCVTHSAKDPARRAKVSVAMTALNTDPGYRKRKATALAAAAAAASPEVKEIWRENGRRTGKIYGGYCAPPEVRRRLSRQERERTLAHIPHAYRGLYRKLMVTDRLLKPERIAIIQQQIERDNAIEAAKLDKLRRAILGDDYEG